MAIDIRVRCDKNAFRASTVYRGVVEDNRVGADEVPVVSKRLRLAELLHDAILRHNEDIGISECADSRRAIEVPVCALAGGEVVGVEFAAIGDGDGCGGCGDIEGVEGRKAEPSGFGGGLGVV